MPIIQQLPEESQQRGKSIAASFDPPRDLEYPHPPLAATKSSMPLILWSLLLLLGILMLLVRTPVNAPAFAQLTEYACDPVPRLPRLGSRLQSYPLNLRCRAGDQVIYQRQALQDGTSQATTKACQRVGGSITIWRMAPPSSYGPYVFQSNCGEHRIVDYKNRAPAYESAQRFIVGLASFLILASAAALAIRFARPRRENKTHGFRA
jgi:hypothetical protein